MVKILIALLTLSAAAICGPLTIQTEELIWTNGLDQIIFHPVTVEGTGLVGLGDIEVITSAVPGSRSTAFASDLVQLATIGDSLFPVEIRYAGGFSVSGDTFNSIFSIFVGASAPHEDLDDGSLVHIVPALNSGNITGQRGSSSTGTVYAIVTVHAPEPGTFMLVATVLIGLVCYSRKRYSRNRYTLK